MGSNLDSPFGDKRANLAKALKVLDRIPGIRVIRASPVYETSPREREDQPWFANQVVELACEAGLGMWGLLTALHAVEAAMGRLRTGEPGERYGPRVIDLDLLLYHDVEHDEPGLTVPHARMRERAFVLVPLADLAPDMVFPDGMSLESALARLNFTLKDGRILQ